MEGASPNKSSGEDVAQMTRWMSSGDTPDISMAFFAALDPCSFKDNREISKLGFLFFKHHDCHSEVRTVDIQHHYVLHQANFLYEVSDHF